MKVAIDLDGTIDADPKNFAALMQALRAAGHVVVVLTGSSDDPVGPKDIAEKKQYLKGLGCGDCYDELVVFPDPPHEAKAAYCDHEDIAILIDNSVKNAELAEHFCTVLVPWASKVG